MNKTFTLLLIALAVILGLSQTRAQYPVWDDPNSLPKWMTPEEELRKHEIGGGFVSTPAPPEPVRSIAEFERMQGALIRYHNGLGIPLSLVVALSQHTTVVTLVSNQTQLNSATNAYQSAGVDLSNCEFIIAATNSIWTRDYGPFWIIDGDAQISVLDFPYNRPRPLDNAVPAHVANYFGVPMYGMNVIHAGGNFMSTGWGIAASTELVYAENGNNQTWVNQQMEDYAGIETYHVTLDPLGQYIQHIDCWAKFLDVDKILIAEVPSTHPRYWAYELVTDYFANQISAYGTPFQIFRVYTPNGQPYTNSLILNHRVYVPTMNSTHDAAALSVYQQALPGYEVIGVYSPSWQSTDALHCRVKEIADIGMLSLRHNPLHGLHNYQPEFEIQAEIIAHSGEELYVDSLFLIYKANTNFLFDTVPLFHVEDHTFAGMIPVAVGDTLITYYLSGSDASGREETWPLIGMPGARSFQVSVPENVIVNPDSLVFDTPEQAIEGLVFSIINPAQEEEIVIESMSMWGEYFTLDMDNPPVLPITIAPGDSVDIRVYVFIHVAGARENAYVYDTLFFSTTYYDHFLKIAINTDILSSVNEPEQQILSLNFWPNPFSRQITIDYMIREANHVSIEIFDLQGRRIATLLDERKTSGQHQLTWNAKTAGQLPEGLYVARMIVGSQVITKRIVLAR